MADPVSKGSRAMRFPRRIVQLGEPEAIVLEEFPSAAVSGKAVHEALVKHAVKHPGTTIAAQWLGPLGWTAFLTVSGDTVLTQPDQPTADSAKSKKASSKETSKESSKETSGADKVPKRR